MLSFVYTIFFLVGNIFILEKLSFLSKKYSISFHPYLQNSITYCIFIIFMILSWSPNMLFGFNGQLKIIQYPKEYLEVRKIL